jgi:hypothetical protein
LGSPQILEQSGISVSGAHPEFLCLARLCDPAQVLRAFRPELKLSFTAREQGFDCVTDSGSRLLSSSEITRLVFGPSLSGLNELSRLVPPVPVWIWGLDAV